MFDIPIIICLFSSDFFFPPWNWWRDLMTSFSDMAKSLIDHRAFQYCSWSKLSLSFISSFNSLWGDSFSNGQEKAAGVYSFRRKCEYKVEWFDNSEALYQVEHSSSKYICLVIDVIRSLNSYWLYRECLWIWTPVRNRKNDQMWNIFSIEYSPVAQFLCFLMWFQMMMCVC